MPAACDFSVFCIQLSTQDTTVFFTESATCYNSKAPSCISLPAIIGQPGLPVGITPASRAFNSLLKPMLAERH